MLWGSRHVVLRLKHWDIRNVAPMFYLRVEWLTKTTITTTTITVFLVPRGVRKKWFQQSAPTHSGAGESETLNINVLGKMTKGILASGASPDLPGRQTNYGPIVFFFLFVINLFKGTI